MDDSINNRVYNASPSNIRWGIGGLNKAKLETNHQEEIYQSLQRAMRSESEEQFKKEEQYLCNLGNIGDN